MALHHTAAKGYYNICKLPVDHGGNVHGIIPNIVALLLVQHGGSPHLHAMTQGYALGLRLKGIHFATHCHIVGLAITDALCGLLRTFLEVEKLLVQHPSVDPKAPDAFDDTAKRQSASTYMNNVQFFDKLKQQHQSQDCDSSAS